MTTPKRELVTTSITDGPPLHRVLTSLSVILPSEDGSNVRGSGFPVYFQIVLPPRKGWRGYSNPNISVVITGFENFEYNYCDLILTGYFKKISTRRELCSYFCLPVDVKEDGIDSVGWLTFRAKYNVHTRKGEITIEYSEENPWFVVRSCKRFD